MSLDKQPFTHSVKNTNEEQELMQLVTAASDNVCELFTNLCVMVFALCSVLTFSIKTGILNAC